MIKRIELKNFQSHKKSALDFHPGVNIIVGTSDSGKTAIIRSLKWVRENRPLGDEFCSHWGGETSVNIVLDDKTVLRTKSKTVNSYEIGNISDAEYQKFKAFGTDVPDQVQDLLNMSDINIQSQLEPHFLLTKSPGEVAGHFNKIARLDDIDFCIKNIQKQITLIENQVKHDKSLQEKRTEQLKTFDYLSMMEVDVEVLEQMESDLTRKNNAKTRLSAHIQKIESTQEKINQFKTVLSIEKEVSDILVLLSDQTGVRTKLDRLSVVLTRIVKVRNTIDWKKELIEDESLVNGILDSISLKKEINTKKEKLTSIGVLISQTVKKLDEEKIQLTEMETLFDEQFPDVCPLCGTDQTKNHNHE